MRGKWPEIQYCRKYWKDGGLVMTNGHAFKKQYGERGQQREVKQERNKQDANTNSARQLKQQQAPVIYSLLPVYRQFPA